MRAPNARAMLALLERDILEALRAFEKATEHTVTAIDVTREHPEARAGRARASRPAAVHIRAEL